MFRFPVNRFVSSAAEALLIAGLSALGVDPLLKRDLLREASQGIFKHMLGFEHLPEVKDKLEQSVRETKLIRKSIDLRCEIEPRDGHFDSRSHMTPRWLIPPISRLTSRRLWSSTRLTSWNWSGCHSTHRMGKVNGPSGRHSWYRTNLEFMP